MEIADRNWEVIKFGVEIGRGEDEEHSFYKKKDF